MLDFYFITGFMGTGKSSVLQYLHSHSQKTLLNSNISIFSIKDLEEKIIPAKNQKNIWIFIDVDSYLSSKFNCSISDFFSQYGEEQFRKQEHIHLQDIFTIIRNYHRCYPHLSISLVMALGGGCIFEEKALIEICSFAKEAQTSRCCNLHAPLSILEQRINKDGIESRPLGTQLEDKFRSRSQKWSEITFIMQQVGISIHTIDGSPSIDVVGLNIGKYIPTNPKKNIRLKHQHNQRYSVLQTGLKPMNIQHRIREITW